MIKMSVHCVSDTEHMSTFEFDDGNGCVWSDSSGPFTGCGGGFGGGLVSGIPQVCCPGSNIYGSWEYTNAITSLPTATPDPLAPPCCDGKCSAFSEGPIRYANGELRLTATDISSSGFGVPWGHTRSFASRMSWTQTVGQGYNWQVSQWSYLIIQTDTVVVQGAPNASLWFDKVGSSYVPRFGVDQTLTLDTAQNRYILSTPDGTVTQFDATTGLFRNESDAAGNITEVTSIHANNYNIATIQRSVTTAGVTTTEQYSYTYDSSSGDPLLSHVTLQRRVGAGSFDNVLRATYIYYSGDDPNGLAEDLRTVVTQVWQNAAWTDTGTSYYRYWLELASDSSSSSSSSSSGGSSAPFAHLPKYVLNASAYARMVADGHDPLTASDSLLLMYSDYYFEYDSQRRVTLETVKSGSQTFQFSYEASGFPDDYNHWKTKSIETLPDGNQNIIYSNYAGQTMLKLFQSGSNQWLEFWRYDGNAKVVLHAHPSAITGYDEESPDLLIYDSESGTFEYLRDNAGLIDTYTYHTPSGNRASESLQKGQLGASIPQRAWEYCECGSDCGCGNPSSSSSSSSSTSSGNAAAVWFLSRETVYPDDTDPERTIVTSHCYTFHDGTCAVKQHTTTLPIVPTEQNGSGVADTRREYFDTYGNLTWTMDERGFITRTTYDIPTGAMVQQVNDADTSLYEDAPAGWATPSGGGKNLITDFEHDDQGRITQTLGPAITTDLSGAAETTRNASWTVYDDVNHATYSAQGLAIGAGPDYEYQLINPVTITKMDAGGRVNEQIQATASETSGTLAEIIADAGSGEAAFPQSSYSRWTTSQYTDCCLAASQRVYHTIPASGAGAPGTNYDETEFGYDVMKRRNRTVSPGGTVTDVVYEPRGMVIGSYVGTNDDGGSETDPTGGGTDPDNNMVIVTASEYDDNTDGGDGNQTEVTQHVNVTTTRVTAMTFDFRNRVITTDGEVDYFEKLYYDNLDRVVRRERYNTTAVGNLIAVTETKYDDRGRTYQTIRYGVDPTTGTIGNSLADNTWYDPSGRVIKSLPSGSKLFTKTTHDSLGRATIRYSGYDLEETSYADAFTVTDDVILEQSETTYDDASNVLQTTLRQRYHNAPDNQTGALQNPTTTPKARVTYSAAWQDGFGRTVAAADYGTNGGTSLSRPATIPAASDTVLVRLTRFDDAGNAYEIVDPAGMVTRFEFDDLGRKVTEIKNYKPASSSSSNSSSSSGDDCEPSDDTNVTEHYTFTPDGQQATFTAVNPRTNDQTTTWTYGTTLEDSDIASSQLLRSLTYPTGGSDVIVYGYNRQGDKISLTDQRGCMHEFEYDKRGRQIQDRVTTVGTGVDDAVLRLSTTYEVRGMVQTLTSWNDASISSGDAVNQCQFVYNDFEQLIADYQEHDGMVNVSTTPVVQYTYADGSANTIRPTTLVYPNGRVQTYGYGTGSEINDAASRICSLIDDDPSSTHLADYSFLGMGQFVVVDYTETDIKYTLVALTGSNDPDTGDIYSGLDRFGRIKDCRWHDYGHATDVVRLQYGYDRASDRLWRADPVAQSLGKNFDELYSYDGLHRLKDMQRGLLSGAKSAITEKTFTQCWSLDPTSNWHGFREAAEGGSWTTIQSRSANRVNEITDITDAVGSGWLTPEYDAAGNAIIIPQPANPTISFTATYDAWDRMVGLIDTISMNPVQQNAYDARNYRTMRLAFTEGDPSEERHILYTADWQSIEERLGTNPNSADPERQHVWGMRYVDDLVVRDRDTEADASMDERLFGLQDINWNMVALSDALGVAQERYLYSPFGSPTFLNTSMSTGLSTSSIDSEILFTGQKVDLLTLLQLFRKRWFESLTGRFHTRDPRGYVDGASLYAGWFVPSDVDPSGENRGDEYGNWCGTTHSDAAGNGSYKDAIDLACKYHDECLLTALHFLVPCRRRICDDLLCYRAQVAYWSGCDNSPTPVECRRESLLITSYMCVFNIADVVFPVPF